MDIQNLKDYIIENEMIPTVLESIGCHSILDKGTYVSAANPDGDNTTAIVVYKDNLTTINSTRDITNGKNSSDVFDLVSFVLGSNFFESVKHVCSAVGISVYHDFMEDLPESIQITQLLMQMIQTDDNGEEDKPLKPIPEKILSYYDSCIVDPFLKDGISEDVQSAMQIGYDQLTNRITIPIRDVYGTLVGVKGRYFGDAPDGWNKYTYLERCNKGRILYGLYRAMPYIKRYRKCYVVESEKGVMQGMSMGVDNIVATSGSKVTSTQIEMLSRLCTEIVFCFDQDISLGDIENIADKFPAGVKVSAMIDSIGILSEKESPTDNEEKFFTLLDQCVVTIKVGELQ